MVKLGGSLTPLLTPLSAQHAARAPCFSCSHMPLMELVGKLSRKGHGLFGEDDAM